MSQSRFLQDVNRGTYKFFRRMLVSGAFGLSYWAMNGEYLDTFKKLKMKGPSKMFSSESDLPGMLSEKAQITPQLQKIIDEVKQSAILSEGILDKIHFELSSNIINPQMLGSAPAGKAIVVIPDYFNIQDIKQLRAAKLSKLIKEVYDFEITKNEEWLTGAGKLLIDSFIISDTAKKFAIAKEVYSCENPNTFRMAICITLVVYMYFILLDLVKTRATKGGKGPLYSTIMSSIAIMFCIANLLLVHGIGVAQTDRRSVGLTITKGMFDSEKVSIDESKAHKVDEEYYDGAMEYYSKEIQRNQSLKALINQVGGVDNYFKGKKFGEDGSYRPRSIMFTKTAPDNIQDMKNFRYGQKLPVHFRDAHSRRIRESDPWIKKSKDLEVEPEKK